MPALFAVLLIFTFQFSLLFFNISLSRPHQQTLPKIWVGTFLVRKVHAAQVKDFDLILTIKLNNRQYTGDCGESRLLTYVGDDGGLKL